MDRERCIGCKYFWRHKFNHAWDMCCFYLDTDNHRREDENGNCLDREDGVRERFEFQINNRNKNVNKNVNKMVNKNGF